MQSEFELSATTSANEPSGSPRASFSWRSAFLGAAVGIAGPAYFGTLFANLTLWFWIAQGHSPKEAYAYLFQFNFSFPAVTNLAADICFAIACGWVSAAYGRGSTISQGIAAGLLSVSFPMIMWLSPTEGSMPLFFRAMSLGIPVLGSVVGAYAYARKI